MKIRFYSGVEGDGGYTSEGRKQLNRQGTKSAKKFAVCFWQLAVSQRPKAKSQWPFSVSLASRRLINQHIVCMLIMPSFERDARTGAEEAKKMLIS